MTARASNQGNWGAYSTAFTEPTKVEAAPKAAAASASRSRGRLSRPTAGPSRPSRSPAAVQRFASRSRDTGRARDLRGQLLARLGVDQCDRLGGAGAGGIDQLAEWGRADQVRDLVDLERLRRQFGAVPIGETGLPVDVDPHLHAPMVAAPTEPAVRRR